MAFFVAVSNRLSQGLEKGETYEYIYDINKGLPELIVEIEGENEYIYIYAGRVISQIGPDGQAYYHQDGLGSIVLITDEDGEELIKYEYDAFGTPDKLLETIHNHFLFTGEPYDENGLIFLRARYYDPATGRFLTRDTYLGTPLSQHLYIYVANNPVLYVDPSGHLKICSLDKIFSGTGSTILGGIAIAAGITALTIATGGAGLALVPALIAAETTVSGAGMVAYGGLEIRQLMQPWQLTH